MLALINMVATLCVFFIPYGGMLSVPVSDLKTNFSFLRFSIRTTLFWRVICLALAKICHYHKQLLWTVL